MRALILEDNADRRSAMKTVLADLLPNLVIEFFVTSKEMIERIDHGGLFDVAFISLDNDLDMVRTVNGELIDAGDGVAVASFLGQISPITPVIVHTTNTAAGDQIIERLGSLHWKLSRVVPYGDLQWVSESWRSTVRDFLVRCTPEWSLSALGTRIVTNAVYTQDFQRCLDEVSGALAYTISNQFRSNDLKIELWIEIFDKMYHSSNRFGGKQWHDSTRSQRIADYVRKNRDFGSITLEDSDETSDSVLSRLMSETEFQQMRWDYWQPLPKCTALLLNLSSSSAVNLNALAIEGIIQEARAILQLALLTAANDLSQQPIVYSETELPSNWPISSRESQK